MHVILAVHVCVFIHIPARSIIYVSFACHSSYATEFSPIISPMALSLPGPKSSRIESGETQHGQQPQQ